MIAHLAGLVPLALGLLVIWRARWINDWTIRINGDLFGWEPGRALQLYGLVVTTGVGAVLALMGSLLLVAGPDAFGG